MMLFERNKQNRSKSRRNVNKFAGQMTRTPNKVTESAASSWYNRERERVRRSERESAREDSERDRARASCAQTLQGGCDVDRMKLAGCFSEDRASRLSLPVMVYHYHLLIMWRTGGAYCNFVDAWGLWTVTVTNNCVTVRTAASFFFFFFFFPFFA